MTGDVPLGFLALIPNGVLDHAGGVNGDIRATVVGHGEFTHDHARPNGEASIGPLGEDAQVVGLARTPTVHFHLSVKNKHAHLSFERDVVAPPL